MKYYVEDLFVYDFSAKDYNKSEDKFLIGYVNPKDGEYRLKDVTTGQSVRSEYFFHSLSNLRSHKHKGADMALSYMTGFDREKATLYQYVLAKVIDSLLSKEALDMKQIRKIKSILNKEIAKNHIQELKKKGISEETDYKREYIEAVPGPAFVITKDQYKEMQEHNQAEENYARLQNFKEYFANINDKTQETPDDENNFSILGE